MTTTTRRETSRVAAFARSQVPRALAIVLIALAAVWLANPPGYSSSQLRALASKFKFQRATLVSASHAHPINAYPVEPPLRKISAWMSAFGASVGLTDADGDGLPNDQCLVDPRTRSVTVAPLPGTGNRYKPFLVDPRPLPYDSTMTPQGCVPGDFNEDGATDLLVYYGDRSPVLFLRRPGTSLDPAGYVRQELVGAHQVWMTDTITQADIDGDGHPDLVVGNYFPDNSRILDTKAHSDPHFQLGDSFSRANNGGGDRVLLWAGGRGGAHPAAYFREAKHVLAPGIAHGWTVAIGAADLTGDMKPDIYIANDMGPDHLLVNQSTPGHVKLTAVTGTRGFTTPSSKVLGHDSFKSMSAAFGDLTGTGRLDIFVSNITSQFALQESNLVWMNNGHALKPGAPAPFTERSEQLGMARSGWGWDAKIGDFANDGSHEVIQAIGFIKGNTNQWPLLQELVMGNDQLPHYVGSWPDFQPGTDLSGHELDAFYARGPSGRFANIGKRIGFNQPMVSRGVALGDVNGDGRLDFALANQWGPSYLFMNQARPRAFLGLQLMLPPLGARTASTRALGFPVRGVAARPAIGAEVTLLLPGGHRTTAQVDGGNGHAGFSAPQLLFGLGDKPPQLVTAQVAWRDTDGVVHHETMKLRPGWHALLLEQR